jgi:hypothetical protein
VVHASCGVSMMRKKKGEGRKVRKGVESDKRKVRKGG